MKILLLGDYSNYHRTLATGLRVAGHDVTVASDGTRWMDTERDIDIRRMHGKIGGLELFGRLMWGDLSSYLRGNDIVALNDLNFVPLRPRLLAPLLKRLKANNGSVFLSSISTDVAYLDMLEATDSPLRYSEWYINGRPSPHMLSEGEQWKAWHNPSLRRYQLDALDMLDGAVSGLYEYHLGIERAMGADRVAYGGIPVDCRLFEPVDLPERPDKVRLFLGRDRSRMAMKGSDIIEAAARRAIERHPGNAELTIVENRPFAEFVELMRTSHAVLDQLYSYTPATTALMAMAYGLNVVSGAEPEYYDFIGEHANRPIVNAVPDDFEALTNAIESIITHPGDLRSRGRASRDFVLKHNDAGVVAGRNLSFWKRKLREKGGELC